MLQRAKIILQIASMVCSIIIEGEIKRFESNNKVASVF